MSDVDAAPRERCVLDATPMQDFETVTDRSPTPLQEISNEMVRIYKDQFGRGPTRARTYYAGRDLLVCLLERTFTPAERNLQAMGEHQRLRDTRQFFQYAETSRFIEPVEHITGRTVRGFIGGVDTQADIATETFVLEPQVFPELAAQPSPNTA